MPLTPASADINVEAPRQSNVTAYNGLNKFGRANNCDSTVATDIWDRANTTDDDDIFTPPTVARVHAITSSSVNDAAAGTGARTIRVWGLTSWTAAETSEDVTMNGTANVNTTNSYVIIHRMRVLTSGGTNINIGTITATAATDGTVTAQIQAGFGQTLMAVYGIPSIRDLYITNWCASLNKGAGATVSVQMSLLSTADVTSNLLNYNTKHTHAIFSAGSSYIQHFFRPYYKIDGPAIVKIQANSNTDNTDVSASFDGFLVDNSTE